MAKGISRLLSFLLPLLMVVAAVVLVPGRAEGADESGVIIPPGPILVDDGNSMSAQSISTSAQVVIDLMVVYTGKAATNSASLQLPITDRIILDVAYMNDAFSRSGVNAYVRLVHAAQVDYEEVYLTDTNLLRLQDPSDGFMDQVPIWRDRYGADVVFLYTGDATYSGEAFQGPSNRYAYGIVVMDLFFNEHNLAHEFGHVLGGGHDLDAEFSEGVFADSHGHCLPGPLATIMAYCFHLGGPRKIPYFSNPQLSLDGVPLGVAGAADIVRTFNITAPTVAGFRPSQDGLEFLGTLPDGLGMVNPTTGIWYLGGPDESTQRSFFFGNPGDRPLFGDWDCDGVDTPGLYRQSDGYAYLRNSNSQGIADVKFYFGNPGDVPIAGDFDGDGCDTLSIYRPSQQRFYVINELGSGDTGLGAADYWFDFGNPGDKPFAGDFDGDGLDEVGLHRESNGLVYFEYHLAPNAGGGTADNQFIYGNPGDRFVAGDWNGDGTESPGVFRPSQSTFYLRHVNGAGNADESHVFGGSSWLPIAGDFGTAAP